MGIFLQTAIIKNCDKDTLQPILKEISLSYKEFNLNDNECTYKQVNNDINILFNDYFSGYDSFIAVLSKKISNPILLLYIYDDECWGYYFYENGTELDCFNSFPDIILNKDNKIERYFGNANIIAKYFNINENDIVNYLKFYDEDNEEDEKAYEEDEYENGDCWQMTDFMNKLGYSFDFE